MADWKQTALQFLERWINQDYVEGAVLTGSRVTKFHDSHSDIDIHIVLSEGTKWRERGNLVIDDYIVEYFANPPSMIRKYMNEDHEQHKRTDARMFSMGETVFDRSGAVSDLKKLASDMIKKKFSAPSEAWAETARYQIWDMHDDLASMYESSDIAFDIYYNSFLSKTYEIYCIWNGEEIIPLNKMSRYVSNVEYRRAFMFDPPRDLEFYAKLVEGLKAADRKVKLNQASLFSSYVLNKMNGFNIDGWRFRTPLE
ncbi:MAG: nucleotidyltransferase domain-containing protein [Thermoplasmata archaeon]